MYLVVICHLICLLIAPYNCTKDKEKRHTHSLRSIHRHGRNGDSDGASKRRPSGNWLGRSKKDGTDVLPATVGTTQTEVSAVEKSRPITDAASSLAAINLKETETESRRQQQARELKKLEEATRAEEERKKREAEAAERAKKMNKNDLLFRMFKADPADGVLIDSEFGSVYNVNFTDTEWNVTGRLHFSFADDTFILNRGNQRVLGKIIYEKPYTLRFCLRSGEDIYWIKLEPGEEKKKDNIRAERIFWPERKLEEQIKIIREALRNLPSGANVHQPYSFLDSFNIRTLYDEEKQIAGLFDFNASTCPFYWLPTGQRFELKIVITPKENIELHEVKSGKLALYITNLSFMRSELKVADEWPLSGGEQEIIIQEELTPMARSFMRRLATSERSSFLKLTCNEHAVCFLSNDNDIFGVFRPGATSRFLLVQEQTNVHVWAEAVSNKRMEFIHPDSETVLFALELIVVFPNTSLARSRVEMTVLNTPPASDKIKSATPEGSAFKQFDPKANSVADTERYIDKYKPTSIWSMDEPRTTTFSSKYSSPFNHNPIIRRIRPTEGEDAGASEFALSNSYAEDCFINSVLQSFFALPGIRKYFADYNGDNVVFNEIKKLFVNYKTTQDVRKLRRLEQFRKSLRSGQQDVTEFIITVLFDQNQPGFENFFQFEQGVVIKCDNADCKPSTRSPTKEIMLSLPVTDDVFHFTKGIEALTASEVIESYDCDKHEERYNAKMHATYNLNETKYFIIAFNLFVHEFDRETKNVTYVKRKLNVVDLNEDRQQIFGHFWQLRSAIKHSGHTIDSGHYTMARRDDEKKKWIIQDGTRSYAKTKLPQDLGDMYVLIFEKIDDKSEDKTQNEEKEKSEVSKHEKEKGDKSGSGSEKPGTPSKRRTSRRSTVKGNSVKRSGTRSSTAEKDQNEDTPTTGKVRTGRVLGRRQTTRKNPK